jgi:hypothetical protein
LKKAVQQIIKCTVESSKGNRKPTRIVVIRDGLSEGQYKMAIENELPAILVGYAEGMRTIGDEASFYKRYFKSNR